MSVTLIPRELLGSMMALEFRKNTAAAVTPSVVTGQLWISHFSIT